jgi:hypothetical protein
MREWNTAFELYVIAPCGRCTSEAVIYSAAGQAAEVGLLLPVATAQVWPQLVGGASCLPRRPASGGADQHHRQRTCFRDGRLSSARRTVGSYPAGLHLRPNHTDLVWQSLREFQ